MSKTESIPTFTNQHAKKKNKVNKEKVYGSAIKDQEPEAAFGPVIITNLSKKVQ